MRGERKGEGSAIDVFPGTEVAGTVVGLDPEDTEGVLVLGELGEVALGEGLLDGVFLLGVDHGNDGSLEAGTGEAATIDAGEVLHDLVDGDELGGAALVVVDAGLAGVFAELAEEFEVAILPGTHTLANTTELAIEVLGTTGEAGRHAVASLLEGLVGDVAEEGFVEGLEGLVLIGEHVPGCRLALEDAEVVVGVDEGAGEAGEEDADLEIRHLGIALHDAVLLILAVEEEEAVLLAQGDAGLVEEAVVETDILALCLGGYLDNLHGLEFDVVGLGESHDVGDEDSSRTAQAADGKGALDDALDASLELEALAEGVLGATGIVAPVLLAHEGTGTEVEFDLAFVVLGGEADLGVLTDVEPEVDAFVDGKAGDDAMLMVDVCAKGADTIGAEDVIGVVGHIDEVI